MCASHFSPQSCLRKCRGHKSLLYKQYCTLTRWSGWIKTNSHSPLFSLHSLLGEGKVPERFHARDRRVTVACSPLQTTRTNTLLPPHLRVLYPNSARWQRENRNLPAKQGAKHSPYFLALSEGLLWATGITECLPQLQTAAARLKDLTKVSSNFSG